MAASVNRFWALLVTTAVLLVVGPGRAFAEAVEVVADEREIFENEWVDLRVDVNVDQVNLELVDDQDFRIEQIPTRRTPFCMTRGPQILSSPCRFVFRIRPKTTGNLKSPVFQLKGDGFFRPPAVVFRSEPISVLVKPGQGDKEQRVARNQGQGMQGGGPMGGMGMGGPTGGMGGPMGGMGGPNMGGMGRPGMGAQAAPEARIHPAGVKATVDQLGNLAGMAKNYDVFVMPRISRLAPYVSEPFVVEHILYVAQNSGLNSIQGVEPQDTAGFRQETLEDQLKELPGQELDGRQFQVFMLGSRLLIPLNAGTVDLPSPKVVAMGSRSSVQRGPSGMTISFSSGSAPVEIYGPSVQLEVKAPPSPMPPDFDGGSVGRLRLSNLRVPEEVTAGSWFFVRYAIEGEGNLFGLRVPQLRARADLVVREPSVDRAGVRKGTGGISGKVEVSLPLRVEKVGPFDLGEITLDYLDPEDGAFKTARLPMPTIQVQPAQPVEGEAPAVQPENLASRARPVLPPELSPGEPLPRGPEPWLWPLVAALLALALGPWLWRLATLSSVRQGRRAKRRSLAEARHFLTQRDLDKLPVPEFYGESARLLRLFLTERFGVPTTGAMPPELEGSLLTLGLGPELARALRNELENCDFARYAPGAAGAEKRADAATRMLNLLRDCERSPIKARRQP